MLSPGSTIGIVGGGQLGRMLAIAAAEMGYHTHIYCPEKDAPAFEVAAHATVAAYDDLDAFARFADSVDVVTIEFENIDCKGLRHIAGRKPVHPMPDVLEVCQHRVMEKKFINSLGVATAPFLPVRNADELLKAAEKLGLPCILKTATMGYDGKGQATFSNVSDAETLWKGLNSAEAILEKRIDFTMEISVIVARGANGEVQCFPPVQNIHKNHILHQTIAPAPMDAAQAKNAEAIAHKIAEGLKLVGILAVEMFVTKDALLVNELAPRPHNSGHWTIDACMPSQFEQTIRAVCGLPLLPPRQLAPAVMTNIIGDDINDVQKWLKNPNARLHVYGKKEARAGRKMGHVTELKAN